MRLATSRDSSWSARRRRARRRCRLAQELLPDIVLLDISMPGWDGLVTAERIATACPATAIVMLTVSEDPDKLLAAFKAGARGVCAEGRCRCRSSRGSCAPPRPATSYVSPSLASEMLISLTRERAPDPLQELTRARAGDPRADRHRSHQSRDRQAPLALGEDHQALRDEHSAEAAGAKPRGGGVVRRAAPQAHDERRLPNPAFDAAISHGWASRGGCTPREAASSSLPARARAAVRMRALRRRTRLCGDDRHAARRAACEHTRSTWCATGCVAGSCRARPATTSRASPDRCRAGSGGRAWRARESASSTARRRPACRRRRHGRNDRSHELRDRSRAELAELVAGADEHAVDRAHAPAHRRRAYRAARASGGSPRSPCRRRRSPRARSATA